MTATHAILAGDIGGTKTNLALYTAEQGPRFPIHEATFPSQSFPDLEAIVRTYLDQTGADVSTACFGVAGPVVQGRAEITNLPWVIDRLHVQTELGLRRVFLINDLQATALAMPALAADDVYTLNPVAAVPTGNVAVIAPGTGLGEAFLAWDGRDYQAYASEGGHCSFAPTNQLQIELLQYMLQNYSHVSFERVCSGLGIPNLYAFLRDRGDLAERPDVVRQLAEARDATPVILNAAQASDPCPLSLRTLQLFVELLGAEASNLALKVMATGGVYLGGGIPPRVLPALSDGRFMQAFTHKGRFSDLLATMPVHVILNSKAALLGAARMALAADV